MHAQNMMNHFTLGVKLNVTTITGYDHANKYLNIESHYRGSSMSKYYSIMKYCRLRVFLLGTCIHEYPVNTKACITPPPPKKKKKKKKKNPANLAEKIS